MLKFLLRLFDFIRCLITGNIIDKEAFGFLNLNFSFKTWQQLAVNW